MKIGYEWYWRITKRILKADNLTWEYMQEIKTSNYLIPSEKCKKILTKLIIDNYN